ncbi:CHAD domain-containing protein [Streptomyces sp. NPDC059740]|uniref:CYTH and CHAD domain-containing protein n=1 Tax=Streptomyces sp. NPDC059740 TaxID=3346926 RepID=UPI003645FDBD
MGQSHTETEHTYQGPGEVSLPELRGLPGVTEVRQAATEELDALYYDTTDLRLLGLGVTLRRRTGGHDAGWHLKVPSTGGDPASRQEYRVPLGTGDDDGLPAELARRVRARSRGADLVPVAHLHTRRTRRLLLDDTGRTLAEVAHDHVSAQIPGLERIRAAGTHPETESEQAGDDGGQGNSAHLMAWSEVEAELVHGEASLLEAVDHRMADAGLTVRPGASKLRQAMESGGRAPQPQTAAPPGSAGEAVLTRLREQRAVLLDADAAVRADEADSVHRMRVAARRLRAALTSYRRLHEAGATRRLTSELKWLGQVLGEARDHEVLAARLHADARELATEPATAAVTRTLAGRVAAQETAAYREAWHRVVQVLDSERYFALLDLLDAHLAAPPFGPRARREAAGELRKAVVREHRRLTRRVERARTAPVGPPRDRALHEARKAAKRLRYAAETARPAAGRPAARLAKRGKRLQQVLGAHQDAVVAQGELPLLADRAEAAGRPTYGYGLLHARAQEAARGAEERWPKAWRKLRKTERRAVTRFTRGGKG